MSLLLDFCYLLLLAASLPWLIWRSVRTGKYRQGYRQKFFGLAPRRVGNRPCIWFHAVSVGEVNLLATLLEPLSRQHPDWDLVVSTTTRTGYELARRKYANFPVFYCPFDFSWAVGRAMRRIRPDLLVLAELELWPNLIRSAQRCGAKAAIVNGRLSDRSFRGYERIRWLTAWMLRHVDLVAAQNDEYGERFRQLGAEQEQVVVTGSVKFDGARTERNPPQSRRLAQLAGIGDDDVVFLAGSTQAPEEQIAMESYLRLRERHPRLRLILVPRHPERFDEVAALLDRAGVAWQRRSQLERDGANRAARVLLVDTIGELGAWWATAAVGFVGGSLGSRGGQNMIEPAACGVPVCFGPNTQNFRDVVALLLAHDAAEVIHGVDELTAFVARTLESPDTAAALGQRARQLVLSQQGAAERTVERLEQLMYLMPGCSRRAAA
jgi:3-deoxy-D-manno-octulosonic-acid transferase